MDSKARYLWVIALSAVLALPRGAAANGADLPPEVVLQGFAKPEDGRLRLLVRVPLVLLSNHLLVGASYNLVTQSYISNPAGYGCYLDALADDNTISLSTISAGRKMPGARSAWGPSQRPVCASW